MARKYNLQPTPDDHEVNKRDWYHDIRTELLRLKREVVGEAPVAGGAVAATAGVDMEPILRPALDQGDEGDCAAFAWCAAKALLLGLNASPVAQIGFDFSQQFAYWVTRVLMGTTGIDSGSILGDVILSAEKTGTCLLSTYPYVVGQFATSPPESAFAEAALYKFGGKSYPVDFTDPGNVTQALLDGFPIYMGFSVPQSFEDCPSSGVLPDPNGEDSLGGHAGLLYYTPRVQTGFWPEQNSWGQSFGVNGRCQMPYSYSTRFTDMFVLIG